MDSQSRDWAARTGTGQPEQGLDSQSRDWTARAGTDQLEQGLDSQNRDWIARAGTGSELMQELDVMHSNYINIPGIVQEIRAEHIIGRLPCQGHLRRELPCQGTLEESFHNKAPGVELPRRTNTLIIQHCTSTRTNQRLNA